MGLSREEMEKKLLKAGSVDEVKSIIEGNDEEISDEDAKKLYDKIKSIDSDASVELSVDELGSVAGGRDYMEEGCHATVEVGSRCWGTDYCTLTVLWYDHAPEQNCPKCGVGMGWAGAGTNHRIIKCPKCGYRKRIKQAMDL